MSTVINVPAFPESVSEGTVAAWNVAVGDAFAEGDILVEIETDKVVMEVPAPEDGVLESIDKEEGDTVTSQEAIGAFKAGAAPKKEANEEKAATADAPKEAAKAVEPASSTSAEASSSEGPSARRMLKEHDLSSSEIQGTGKAGRVTRQDVQSHLSHVPPAGRRVEERVPMTRLRKTVAKRLLEVQQSNAILTTFNEIDMHAVKALRGQYKEIFEKKHGIKLGFMSFFLKAATEALKQFPAVNGSIDGEDIIYHSYFDIGVAVSSPRGLVVPVVRDVDQLSLAGIESSIMDYAIKAKEGKLGIEEMQGGTFTVTNGGVFGSMLSTPIINPPQSAILGMHNIVERPVVVNGEIVVRPIMYVALSYDHRIIDGRESVSFLKTIKELIEDPSRLLLGV